LEIDGAEVNIMQKVTDLLNFCADINNTVADCYNEVLDEWKRTGLIR
jgi:hypothetical protein